MSKEIVQLKVRLPTKLIQQIQGVSKEPVAKIIQDAVTHYIATYASETVIAEAVTQYITSTEKLFEENFDKLTNLMASLSYVSKFNNNILNAIFINNGGNEDELERLYNEATQTVQKYFHFEDNDSEVLPIMEENDQLKLKVQALEKKQTHPPSQQQNLQPAAPPPPPPPTSPPESGMNQDAQEQIKKIQREKEKLEEQKKELIEWINGLILYVVQNYSHFRRNEKLLREYIKKHPKPKV